MATTTNTTANRSRPGDAQMMMLEAAYYRQQLSLGELSSLAEDQKANNEQMKAIRALQDKLRTFLSAGGRDGLKELDENEMAELVRDAAALGIDLSSYQRELFPGSTTEVKAEGTTAQNTKDVASTPASPSKDASPPAPTPKVEPPLAYTPPSPPGTNTGGTGAMAGAGKNFKDEQVINDEAERRGGGRRSEKRDGRGNDVVGDGGSGGTTGGGSGTSATPPATTVETGEVRRRWVGSGDDYKAARDTIENIQQSLASALDDVKSNASSKELDIQRVSQEVSTWTQMASTLMKKFSDTVMSVVRNIG